MAIGCIVAVALALWLIVSACAGCTTVDGKRELDTCQAVTMAQAGHQVASGASLIICNALSGEARVKCLERQGQIKAAADALIGIAGAVINACTK